MQDTGPGHLSGLVSRAVLICISSKRQRLCGLGVCVCVSGKLMSAGDTLTYVQAGSTKLTGREEHLLRLQTRAHRCADYICSYSHLKGDVLFCLDITVKHYDLELIQSQLRGRGLVLSLG